MFGHLETAKWVLTLGGVDVHAKNDFAFRRACMNGHLETAKWVLTLGGVDVHAENDYAFRGSCMNGHLETAKWVLALDPEKMDQRDLAPIKTWGNARDVWIRATVSA
jgi:hypothetical protein